MPFPNQTPRFFSRGDIESIAVNQYGCYGIFHKDAWIYVGKGNIRSRLLDHLNGDNPDILTARPTHWVGVVTDNMEVEEKRLILELRPICNKRIG